MTSQSCPSSSPDGSDPPSLRETLAEMRKLLAPVFDEQRQTWERERPAAMAALAATGATLDGVGGNCPVQAEGDADGERFYFRARGDSWQFHVAATDDLIFRAPSFYIERDYGEGFDAGWMPNHEAIGFIVQAIGEYRAAKTDGSEATKTGNSGMTSKTPSEQEASDE